jgi:hypothetical protein
LGRGGAALRGRRSGGGGGAGWEGWEVSPVRPLPTTTSLSLRSDPASPKSPKSPASPADLADSELPLLAAGGGAGGRLRLSDEAVRGAQTLCAAMVARLQEVVCSQEERMLKVLVYEA